MNETTNLSGPRIEASHVVSVCEAFLKRIRRIDLGSDRSPSIEEYQRAMERTTHVAGLIKRFGEQQAREAEAINALAGSVAEMLPVIDSWAEQIARRTSHSGQ